MFGRVPGTLLYCASIACRCSCSSPLPFAAHRRVRPRHLLLLVCIQLRSLLCRHLSPLRPPPPPRPLLLLPPPRSFLERTAHGATLTPGLDSKDMDGADEDADADAGGTEIEISSDPYDSTELCAMRVPGAAGAAPRAGEGMLPVCVTLRCARRGLVLGSWVKPCGTRLVIRKGGKGRHTPTQYPSTNNAPSPQGSRGRAAHLSATASPRAAISTTAGLFTLSSTWSGSGAQTGASSGR